MRSLRALFLKISGMFSRRRRDWEMEHEFQAHLQMQIDDNIRSGMNAEEARREALLKTGGLEAARENYREQGGLPFLETLSQDVRYGARMLRKNPGFTFVAVLTLALGIGANTAIFSVVNAVLLAKLPVAEPDRLVALWETESSPGNFPFAAPDYLDWQAQNQTLESSVLYRGTRPINGSHNGESQSVMAMATQATYFSVLGVKAQIGRTFLPGEDQAANRHVAVLSYGFWLKSFAGRQDALNQTLELDNEKYSVIGVLPEWFRFPLRAEVFIPLDMNEKALPPRGTHGYLAMARLKKGVSSQQAQADLATIAARLEKQFPNSNNKVSAVVVPLAEQLVGNNRRKLLLLLAAVGAVLLLACANVANLLLAKATGRQKEMSLRAVLGASRRRVVRQLLTESVMLSLSGGLIGLAAGVWLVKMMEASQQLPIPRHNAIQIDQTVLLFTFLLSVVVGVVFGLAPAFQAAKAELGEELKSTAQTVVNASRFTRLLRDGLVVAELSVSLVLLVVAGLLLHSFVRMNRTDLGVDPQNVMTGLLILPDAKYPTQEARGRFCDRLLQDVHGLPGVQSAALSTEIPPEGGWNGSIEVPSDKDPAHASQLVEYNYVSPGYFKTMGIPLKRGAIFTPADMERAAAINLKLVELYKQNPALTSVPPELTVSTIINSTMARMYWPNQEAVGKTFKGAGLSLQVVGIVGDVKQFGARSLPTPQAYFPLPLNQDSSSFGAILTVKSTGSPESVVAGVRGRLRDIDGSLAFFDPRTMDTVIAQNIQDASLETWMFGSLALLALVLASVGLYSVLAYLVSQRTREIGIRMALGAQPGHVLKLIMKHALALTTLGIVLGVLATLLATRLMEGMLFGVTQHDPLTFFGVVGVLTAVALVACYVPARRAARVDPLVALRYE